MFKIKTIQAQNSKTLFKLDNRLKYEILQFYPILYNKFFLDTAINQAIKQELPFIITNLKNIKNSLLYLKSLYQAKITISQQEINTIKDTAKFKHSCFYEDLKSSFIDCLNIGFINIPKTNKTLKQLSNIENLIYNLKLFNQDTSTAQDKKTQIKARLNKTIKDYFKPIIKEYWLLNRNKDNLSQYLFNLDNDIKHLDNLIKSHYKRLNAEFKPLIRYTDLWLYLTCDKLSFNAKSYLSQYIRKLKVNQDSKKKALYLNDSNIKKIANKFYYYNLIKPLSNLKQEIAINFLMGNLEDNNKIVSYFVFKYRNSLFKQIHNEIDHRLENIKFKLFCGILPITDL